MRLHNRTHKMLLFILCVAAIDLITKQLWAIALYAAGWSVLLFRESRRNIRTTGIVAPVTGVVTRIFKSKINDRDTNCIRIDTRPILDPQTFRVMPGDKIQSVVVDLEVNTIQYESGLVVKHIPVLGYSRILVSQDNVNAFSELSSVYGYSFLGCSTNIMLPQGFSATLVEGQKVIDGETIIGGQQ